MHHPEYVPENETHKPLWGLGIKRITKSLPGDLSKRYAKKKVRTCRIVDIAVLADNSVKLKESEKSGNYQDLTR